MPQKTHFDTLILGAGSCGSVLAGRLSEQSDRRVGVVEAGEWPSDPDIAVPRLWPLLQGRSYDWRYSTVGQSGTAGRRHPWPRGRIVGGSSCLHAMAHVRGHPTDFDAWTAAGGARWSFDRLLPWFKRSERFSGGASDWHGDAGPLDVLLPSTGLNPVAMAFMAASEDLGIPRSGDHNGPRMRGAAANSLTIRDGQRLSVADAYLSPVRDRANLSILTGRIAERLTLSGGRVTGVITQVDGGRETLTADRVVLATGAIATPLLLMRSGIGPADHLRDHGIDVLVDLPMVGENLQDHLLAAGNVYLAKRPVPVSNYQVSESLLYHGGPDDAAPEVAVACVAAPVVSDRFTPPAFGEAFTFTFGVCKPASRGRIRLTGADHAAAPAIDPNYLAEPADRAKFRDAFALAREVAGAAPMDGWRGAELLPGPDLPGSDPSALDLFIARSVMTHHHPCGTCRMGSAADGVVDGDLSVHGVDNLSIVDASVIPEITSGPINAALVAMAEMTADTWMRGRSAPLSRPSARDYTGDGATSTEFGGER